MFPVPAADPAPSAPAAASRASAAAPRPAKRRCPEPGSVGWRSPGSDARRGTGRSRGKRGRLPPQPIFSRLAVSKPASAKRRMQMAAGSPWVERSIRRRARPGFRREGAAVDAARLSAAGSRARAEAPSSGKPRGPSRGGFRGPIKREIGSGRSGPGAEAGPRPGSMRLSS